MKRDQTPVAPEDGQGDWHVINETLNAEQYEQAAQLLQTAHITSDLVDDTLFQQFVAMTQQITLALATHQAEAIWHQQAQIAINERTDALKKQLDAIFSQISTLGQLELQQNADQRQLTPIKTLTVKKIPDKVGLSGKADRFNDKPLIVDEDTDKATQGIDSPPFVNHAPSLVIYTLGPFHLYHNEQLVDNWASSKGKSIFKYMVLNRERAISKEILMDLFWPDAAADAARNNLNVAIYGLRRTLRQILPDFSHILFQDDRYLLNPELQIWIDVDAFREHFNKAQLLENQQNLTAAIQAYRAAEALYHGELLEEDRYEEWVIPQRQSLQDDYQKLLDRLSRYYFDALDYNACLSMCERMLKVDVCAEEAHRRRMRCYSRQGQPYLALRQYHQCVEALMNELDVEPGQPTIDLYEQIRQRQDI